MSTDAEWDGELRRHALDALFLENHDTMYVLDPTGRFVAGNRALAERTGVPWEQLREMDFDPTIHPDDRDRVRAAFDAAAAGTTQRFEAHGIRPDGTEFHSHAVNVPVFDDGKVIAVVAIAHEIDELADIRLSLDRSDQRLTAAFDGMTDAFAFMDADWNITLLNARAKEMIGPAATGLLGTGLWDLPIDDPEGAEMFRAVRRDGRPRVTRRFDEERGRWLEATVFPAGDLVGLQVRDVHESEEARRRILDDSRRIHAQSTLLDSARDGILMRGLGDIVEYANRATSELLGTGDEPLVGRRLRELLALDDEQVRELESAMSGSGSWESDLVVRRPDGSERIAESRFQVVLGPDGAPDAVFCFLMDVTERRQQDAAMLRAQRLESIGTLASGIAHDLNNVLTPLLLATQLLTAGETDEKRLRMLEGMRQTVERGSDMIRQVLTFARGVEGERTAVDIAMLSDRFAAFCRDILPKNIEVAVQSEPDLTVLGDPTQLMQVLMNLATNARDAMPNGGHLWVSASGDDGQVVIEVTDDGAGMALDQLGRIFEPFYTTKGLGRGTGLGLSVSQAIARTHGGSLEATSAPGAGSTFRLQLPRTESVEAADPDVERTPAVCLEGVRVLIVDDEDGIVDLASMVIASSGGFASGATDATEAERMLAESEFDVVLTDLVMPGVSGREFLDRLTTIRPDLPVVAMSGVPEQGAHAARRDNVRATLDKPFTTNELVEAIRLAVSGAP